MEGIERKQDPKEPEEEFCIMIPSNIVFFLAPLSYYQALHLILWSPFIEFSPVVPWNLLG